MRAREGGGRTEWSSGGKIPQWDGVRRDVRGTSTSNTRSRVGYLEAMLCLPVGVEAYIGVSTALASSSELTLQNSQISKPSQSSRSLALRARSSERLYSADRTRLPSHPPSTNTLRSLTPLAAFVKMHSHHSHSGQFCRHAKDNLEDVVKEAIRQGFTTFGLSEHAPRYREQDLFPEEVSAR